MQVTVAKDFSVQYFDNYKVSARFPSYISAAMSKVLLLQIKPANQRRATELEVPLSDESDCIVYRDSY